MDLNKLLNREPADRLETSVGELCLFSLGGNDQTQLLDDVGQALSESDPAAFIRKFIRYVCFPLEQLRDGKYKPNTPILEEQALAILTDEDLEKIASSYIAHHEDLNKEQITERSKNAAGEIAVSFRFGEIKHPRKDSESVVQYLARLLRSSEQDRRASYRRLYDEIRKSFSGSLAAEIQRTNLFGDELLKSIEGSRKAFEVPKFNAAVDSFVASVAPETPKLPLGENFFPDMVKQQERARWAPFKMLDKSMDTLIGLSKAAIEFSVQENRTQTEIATVLKQSGDENKKATQLNTRLTWGVIALTTCGVLAALYPVYHDVTAGEEERHQTQAHVDRVVAKLDTVGRQIATANGGQRKIDDDLRQEIEELRATVARQSQQIEELRRTQKPTTTKGK